ncbi:putative THUMP domain-containing protein [Helianthus debilis subsp. tardiflorus]
MAELEVTNKNTAKDLDDDAAAAGEMKPWEQHSAVISIPRYDYKAPSSLLHRSFSGFLVTCPISLEKSATKEAMTILHKYLGAINTRDSITEEDPQNIVSKRRKVATTGTEECSNDVENEVLNENNGAIEVPEGSCVSTTKSDANTETSNPLSLVKLTRSGLLLFTFSNDHSPDVVDIVSNIMQSLESGSLKAPLWCHRILPIQTTCVLHEKELGTLVSKLVADFLNNEGKELARPIKFAVGYNRRGIEETELKGKNNDSNPVALLDRNKCFEVVAAAVKNIVSDSVVDLKCPELTVLIEVLPVSGIPNGSPIVAVSVLPQKLIMTKPRLCIRALFLDVKSKK